MIVIFRNELYQSEMSYLLFQSLKNDKHYHEVELLQLTNSTYKRQVTAPISECEDYSIARNLQALNKN